LARPMVLFRDDLRLADHPALSEACKDKRDIICLLMLDKGPKIRPMGGAARWWLHGAIASLRAALRKRGGELLVVEGDARDIVPHLARHFAVSDVYAHYRYGSAERDVDATIGKALEQDNIGFHQYHAAVLCPPETIKNGAGQAFKVFSAFWRAMQAGPPIHPPLPPPAHISFIADAELPGDVTAFDESALLPTRPDWAKSIAEVWTPGEEAGLEILRDFTENGLADYNAKRNFPSFEATSRLSPYLRFGHVSPKQIFHAIADKRSRGKARFQSEIAWRDFAIYNLLHSPDMTTKNLRPQFNHMAWRHEPNMIRLWQKGQTGIPIVDAGMRQLWQTGWMHNRVRMIVGSFLTKHLLTKWQEGEAWFWDTLVDADAASNAMNWQWVAGSGIDAAPYFRILNPVLQGEKFDGQGDYVRHFIPEIAKLPDAYIQHPWDAPEDVLKKAQITLGKDYPNPCIDIKEGRARAMKAFEAL